MNGVVYMITCRVTGHRYIGSTVDFLARMCQYKNGGGHRLIGESIAEHGWGNHDVIKLAHGISDAELRACGYEFIAELQPEINLMTSTAGGRMHHAESSKQLMSAKHRGKKMPPEAVAKTAAANRGKKRSPETRAKISAAGKGRKASPETRAKMQESQKEHHHIKRKHKALNELRSIGWPVAA